MTKTISGYKELPNFVEQISLGEFLPAHYRIRVALIVQNREILFETEEFDVTHAEFIARPWIYSQLLSESPSFEVHVLLGESYRELGNHEKAIEVFDKAIRLYGVNTLVLNALGGVLF